MVVVFVFYRYRLWCSHSFGHVEVPNCPWSHKRAPRIPNFKCTVILLTWSSSVQLFLSFSRLDGQHTNTHTHPLPTEQHTLECPTKGTPQHRCQPQHSSIVQVV
jgi:hypothetical protein